MAKYRVEINGEQTDFDDLQKAINFAVDELSTHNDKEGWEIVMGSCMNPFSDADLSLKNVKKWLKEHDGEINMGCQQRDKNGKLICTGGAAFIFTMKSYNKMIKERNEMMQADAEEMYEGESVSAFDGTIVYGKKKGKRPKGKK